MTIQTGNSCDSVGGIGEINVGHGGGEHVPLRFLKDNVKSLISPLVPPPDL